MLAQLLLSISILVAVHEMGHLLAAKRFGMRVEKFSIGFPPTIWSFKWKGTVYAISAVPLGGFVKISGMIDESLDTKSLGEAPQPWEFRSKPAWQRLIVMLGGITVNLIVGILIFIGITWAYGDTFIKKDYINSHGGYEAGKIGKEIGLETGDKILKVNGHDYKYLDDLVKPEVLLSDHAYYTVERDGKMIDVSLPEDLIGRFNRKNGISDFIFVRIPPQIGDVADSTIAHRVGLKPGDVFTQINGQPIQYFDQVVDAVNKLKESKADSVSFTVMRDGQPLSFRESFKGQTSIGFHVSVTPDSFLKDAQEQVRYGFFQSIPLGAGRAFSTLAVQVMAFGKVISGALPARETLSGPIGIMQAFSSNWDWERFWSLTGVLSLVLAFMNLLPIPALDGGHVMFLTYEMISGRKPSDRFLENAQKVGMAFLLVLIVFIFYNDISKLFH